MKVREYITKIGENKNVEDMKILGDMLEGVLYQLKEYDEDTYEKYKMKLYEMAYGKVLTKEMAENWVNKMKPEAKWSYDTTTSVKKQYGIDDIDEISFYVVMNMLYSDMSNVLGDGDTDESLATYIQATRDWLKDEDIKENKLYDYWKYVAR